MGYSAKSHASTDASLWARLPEGLRTQAGITASFDDVRAPLIKADKDAQRLTEKERREQGDGTRRIPLEKPFPELKPKYHSTYVKRHINHNDLEGRRQLVMDEYRQQEQQQHQSAEQTLTPRPLER